MNLLTFKGGKYVDGQGRQPQSSDVPTWPEGLWWRIISTAWTIAFQCCGGPDL